MNRKLRCAHCRHLVVPNPRVKAQRFCSNPAGQRARKTQWQRDKMATDPDYQANQMDYQQTWQHQHPDYWRQYRQKRLDYCERNRLLQKHRDQKRQPRHLAKMDALAPVSFVKPGIYHLIPDRVSDLDLTITCAMLIASSGGRSRGIDRTIGIKIGALSLAAAKPTISETTRANKRSRNIPPTISAAFRQPPLPTIVG